MEIGLTEEQANKVFALNGQDVEREKAKTTAARADLADAQGKLTAVQTELEGLKKAGATSPPYRGSSPSSRQSTTRTLAT